MDNWNFEEDDDGSMPPPPPPPVNDERDFNDIESESGSVNEESIREASVRRSGGANGSTSSRKRRRRSHSRSHSHHSHSHDHDPAAASSSSSSRPLMDVMVGGGAFRERISEDAAPLFSAGGRSAERSRGGGATAAEVDFARAALRSAQVPEADMGAVLAAAIDDRSFERNYAVPSGYLYDPEACPICEEVGSM